MKCLVYSRYLEIVAIDALIITCLLFNRKEAKESLDNIGMPFTQLCQEAALNILQICSQQVPRGKGLLDNRNMPRTV